MSGVSVWGVLAINGAPPRAFEKVSLPLDRRDIRGSEEVFERAVEVLQSPAEILQSSREPTSMATQTATKRKPATAVQSQDRTVADANIN